MKAILTYARIVRERYTFIIIGALVIALAVGLFTSTPGTFIRQFNVPLIVVLIAAMSFTITFSALGKAIKNWKGTIAGLVLNFLFAPFLCWILSTLLLFDHPELATGLILIGVVPCAGMAMMWTGLLKGDVPLAVVIEAITMLMAPILIPLLMILFAGKFVTIDTWSMFESLMITVLLPVIGAIALRELLERRYRVDKFLQIMPAISATMAVFLMFMAINTATPAIVKNLYQIVPIAASTILVFPILFIVAHYTSARLFPRGTSIAVTYSSGMKNLPLAIGIATMSFKGPVSLPIAVAFAFQMLTAVAFYQLFRRARIEERR
ncbi:MAG: arsenic resistance protein [Thermoplasmata archaeon]